MILYRIESEGASPALNPESDMNKTKNHRSRSRQKAARPLSIAVDFPWDASACMGTGAYSETMVRALAKARPDFRISLLVSGVAPRGIDLPNVRYISVPPTDVLREG